MRVPSLSRVTSGGVFIPEVDGLRFIAIASVVLLHLQWALANRFSTFVPANPVTAAIGHGARGVQIFFAISGFILGLPFASHALAAGPPVSLRKYFLRRVTRLEPPYIVCMLLLFLVEVARHRYSFPLLQSLLASLVYLHNAVFGMGSWVNGVAWSLEVEVQFYCLVPLLAAVFWIRHPAVRRTFLLITIVSATLAQWHYFAAAPRFHLSILFQAQFFLVGFLLADLYVCEWKNGRLHHWAWDVAALLGWPLLFLFPDGGPFWITMPLLAAILFCSALNGNLIRKVLSNRWIATIGGMCYTIYLLHYAVTMRALILTHRVLHGASYPLYYLVQLLLLLPALAVFCVAFFLLIERPCMRSDWPQRLWDWLHSRRPDVRLPRQGLPPAAENQVSATD